MNLWVNRLRQLALLAVALFFFACEDETSFLGYRNPNAKFEGKYVEIPLNTSVFLMDSVRTSNTAFPDEFGRLLVGAYYDGELGTAVQSHAVTEFYNSSAAKIPAEVFADFNNLDSVSINLEFDYYVYGSRDLASQTVTVYEVEEPLDIRHKKIYNSYTEVAHKPEILGQKTFNLNPLSFRDSLRLIGQGDNSVGKAVLRIKVQNQEFINRLWELAKTYTTSTGDSTFVKYDSLKEVFKGLYIESSLSDKVIAGFTLQGATGMTMHYHTDPTKPLVRTFPFQGVLNYSNIKSSWNGLPINAINKYTDLVTAPGNRYIQSGTGIVTRVSLDNFYQFATNDTVQNILMNSAQLVINGVIISTDSLSPPSSLAMRWLSSDNKLAYLGGSPENTAQVKLYNGVVTADYGYYDSLRGWIGNVLVDNNKGMLGISDGGTAAAITYSSSEARYSAFLTLLFQKLYKNRNEPYRYNSFALYPATASAANYGAKSVNRVIFPSDQVMLRIYYTEPTFKQND